MSEREDWCDIHKVTMKRYEKEGRHWHAHKTEDPAYNNDADKGWCHNKPPRGGKKEDKAESNFRKAFVRAILISSSSFSLEDKENYAFYGKKPERFSPETSDGGYPPIEEPHGDDYPKEEVEEIEADGGDIPF